MATENFIIDPLQSNDAKQLFELMQSNNERFKRYFPRTILANTTLEETTAYIATKNKEIAEKSNFTFAIREKTAQNIIGLIILKKLDWNKKQGEFAYCIGSEMEGKGITSFAVQHQIQFAFEELGLKTLQIISHKTNIGSIKVAENNGFIWKGTLTNEFIPIDGIPLDMELYELTNER